MEKIDYRKEFKERCLTCVDYEIYDKDYSTHRGFRCKRYRRPMAFDEKCYYYQFNEARGNNIIHDAVEWRVRKGYDPKPDSSYWYIVSTISTILRMNHEQIDTDVYMNAFKTFKDVLLQYPNGIRFLARYDINGLRLASILLDNYCIRTTQQETVFFVKDSLLPLLDSFVNMVNYNNHPGALKVYTKLMNELSIQFDYTPVEITPRDEINPEMIGSGRVRKLLQSVE